MAVNQLELDRQQELAAFLRSRRARIAPEQVGLPRGTRRRTPGLRRGEVAALAGVSPEWYTWLEQGRDIHVSGQLLESLARVLQLDENERTHLFLLALRQSPPVETYTPPTVSPTLQHFLDQLGTIPACAVDVRMNIVAWNAAQRVVFGNDTDVESERDRNLIWRIFSRNAQEHNESWEKLARVYLAQFRAEYGRFINDPWWAKQIAELSEASPEFRELWERHDVLNISEGQKTMHHPLVGALTFDSLWFQTADSRDLRLLIHTPRSGTDTAEKIERLLRAEQQ
jgi:transcriptional regulator with XRE-family HTH domain